MILSIVVILLIAVVAYYHYLQGLFSATLSAIVAVLAALLAIGWHEALTDALLGGKFADQAWGITLVAIFAIAYLALRVALDMLVPGNVRLPLLMDKIGAPVMGVIAGIAATGVLTIAAQTLPFGRSVAGHARFPQREPYDIVIKPNPQAYQMVDRRVVGIDGQKFHDNDASKLSIPVDDMMLGLAKLVSGESGSLECGRPLAAIHPDYLREMSGQRLGIETGAKHTMLRDQLASAQALRIDPQVKAEDPEKEWARKKEGYELKLNREPGQMLMGVRASIDLNATDDDKLVRLSCGAVRLVLAGRDYFPIGTLDATGKLHLQAPDDPLFANPDNPKRTAIVDFVFVVEGDAFGAPGARALKMPPGSFIEIKRLARKDLSNQTLTDPSPSQALAGLIRRSDKPPTAGGDGPKPPVGPGPSAAGKFAFKRFDKGGVFGKIGTDIADPNGTVSLTAGSLLLKGGQVQKIRLEPKLTRAQLERGSNPATTLYIPPGKQLVWVTLTPAADAGWDWAGNLGVFELTTGDGKKHAPWGIRVIVDDPDTGKVIFVYDDAEQAARIDPATGRAVTVSLIFMVAADAFVDSIGYSGQVLHAIKQPAK
jgi:hypothetical protein